MHDDETELWKRFFEGQDGVWQEAIIEIGMRLRETTLTEEPANVIVPIGPWKGRTVGEVVAMAPGQAFWLERTGASPAYLRLAISWVRQTQRHAECPLEEPSEDSPWNSQ